MSCQNSARKSKIVIQGCGGESLYDVPPKPTILSVLRKIYNNEPLDEPDYEVLVKAKSATRIIMDAISKGVRFPNNMLIQLHPNPQNLGSFTHEMARAGYKFSFKDIMELGNPVSYDGITLAHQMVALGSEFSIEELLEMGNPATTSNLVTVAHAMIVSRKPLGFSEIKILGNPMDGDGCSLSHHMVRYCGHRFSIEEIVELGNPSDGDGKTLSFLMGLEGHEFSKKEIFFIESGLKTIEEMELAWRFEQGESVLFQEIVAYPSLVERYANWAI